MYSYFPLTPPELNPPTSSIAPDPTTSLLLAQRVDENFEPAYEPRSPGATPVFRLRALHTLAALLREGARLLSALALILFICTANLNPHLPLPHPGDLGHSTLTNATALFINADVGGCTGWTYRVSWA
ncbi:hypothetical protein EDB83DRAFT_2515912 [Lactarius deliciosus]|nr:hypothetical protein EDB83DRAFT_2515912 [Lactarius deliciosus]